MAQAQIPIPSRPARPPSFGRILLTTLAIAVWLLALTLAGGVIAYQIAHEGRIFAGVSVRGIDLSGMTVGEAQARLAAAFTPYPLAPLAVRYGDEAWTLTADDLGVHFDARSAAAAAYQVGRQAPAGQELPAQDPLSSLLAQAVSLQSNVQAQLDAYRQGREVLAAETVDNAAGLAWLAERKRAIDRPAIEASLRIEGLQAVAGGSQVGRTLDVAASQRAIYAALLANEGATVDLVVRTTPPLLADVDQAAAFVRQVFAGPATLVAPQPDLDTMAPPPSYTISAEQLAPLVALHTLAQPDGSLALTATLDTQPLSPLVRTWAAELAREPRDARLDFEPSTGQISVLAPSQIGRVLDVEATLAAIRQAALSPGRQAALPLRLVEPGVNMHRIEEMGIVEEVVRASTSFAGSSKDRVHNIATAAAAVHGTVTPPGGIFSFNQAIGDVDAEHGYRDSLIIWGDRTAVGIGGGVCQVSTTAFRTAYQGGLEIVERYNHGYVVGWYGAPGLDATIYTPNIDFKFRNTTGHYLLIETEMNERRGTLTFIFYGSNPGWRVTLNGPQVTDETPPGPPVYQEDASLAPGEVRQVEWAKNGQDVQWRRVIEDAAGETLSEDVLRSQYVPWPAYYLVGPDSAAADEAESPPLSGDQQEGQTN